MHIQHHVVLLGAFIDIFQVIYLTWWPIFRDSIFYMLSVVVLVVVISDNIIHW